MFTESIVVSINQPPEIVFEYINNLDNIPTWQGGIEKVSYTHNPAGLGTHFRIDRSLMGKHFSTTMKITNFTENQGYIAQSVGGPVTLTIEVFLKADNGKTNFSTVVKGEAKGLARLAESLIAAQMAISLREDGERLKSQLESTGIV